MNIWLINHYAVPPQYYPLARQYNFAKCLMARGHSVTIFAASTVHNSDKNLIIDGARYKEEIVDGIPYVYIRCKDYKGNGLSRIYNMIEFALKLPAVCKKYKNPDAIVSTSVPPTSCAVGVRLAKKYGCKAVAEIADLWPESIIAYGMADVHNPAIIALRCLEKWIYTKADAVVFTVEGGYDYIMEQHWESAIPREKIYYINNGILLDQYEENKRLYPTEDKDLCATDKFNFVYVGSIRRANNLDLILDVAKQVTNPKVIFLIWGGGDELDTQKKRVEVEGIKNVIFKGKVEKKYIPGIASKADVNFYVLENSPLFRFGLSLNKSFDYLAAGKPIMMIGKAKYNVVAQHDCGIQLESWDIKEAAVLVEKMANLDKREYDKYCTNSITASKEYDFNNLTEKLLKVIENC